MSTNLFVQTVIAVVWDFDKTLIPGYMQTPMFREYEVDETAFWAEVNSMPKFYRDAGLELVSPDTLYLNHILTYVRHGKFPGFNKAKLRSFGAALDFYQGLPDFFRTLQQVVQQPPFSSHGISVEHYIVSTGLRQIILGSAVAPFVEGVWACEFVESVPPPGYLEPVEGQQSLPAPEPFLDIGYVIDNTTKTRAIFEINKGTNKYDQITVNASVPPEDRRIPFQNMIYVADGPSDIPVFSIVNQYKGRTYAVYRPHSRPDFLQAKLLLDQQRVQGFGEADYREGSATNLWLTASVEDIAKRIVADRQAALQSRIGAPPQHIVDKGDVGGS
jgi:hypothetical protein